MRKKSTMYNWHTGAGKWFVILCAASLLMVYAASAAPQKSASPQSAEISIESEPSLFAPPAPTVKRKNGVPADQSTKASKKRGVARSQDWTMAFDVQRNPAENWEDAYYRHFKKHQIHPRAVRSRVRVLTEQKSPDLKQVIGMLRAALRAGQIQPWMYEALALAMRIEKEPQAEIERVLLSSADFATSARQIIFLAQYMDRLGYRQRALELLREVTLRDPASELAYAKALDLAIYLDDDEALRWATLGVLSQEWSREDMTIFNKAVRHSKALVEKMREEGKNQQADQYVTEVKHALQRDIVVKVSWSGDADVDLMVEEPTGSVCSYRQNKTPGGGLLVGDPNAMDQATGERHAEVYSCPQAFSGDYRVLLRQIWGRIPAGRVTVDVWSHLGTEKEKHIQKVIPLDENGAMVSFQLDEGRRKENLADQQLVNDVVQQVAVNRTILAQQLESISNPEALLAQQNYQRSQPASQIGNRFDPINRPAPNAFNPNLVGYQPQITVLPVGMTMQANAVISADRRYVRITAFPFFSTIKGVVQYNLQSGVTDQAQSDDAFQDLDLNDIADGGGGGGVDADGGGEAGGQLIVDLTTNPVAGGPAVVGVVTRLGTTTGNLSGGLSS